MQTIKTAAIVVLLMSVVYGAWVSLTTPPDSLPPDVVDMIVMDQSGEFPMESALPPSLGDLEINTGTPGLSAPGDSFAAGDGSTENGSLASDQIGLGTGNPGDATATPPGYSQPDPGQLDNVPVAKIASADTGFSTTLTDRAGAGSNQVGTALGNDLSSTGSNAIDPQSGYQTTGSVFRLPDPNQLDPSNFGGSKNPALTADNVAQVSAISENIGTENDYGMGAGSGTNVGLANAIRTADSQYAKDQLKEALSTLSIFYSTPNLSGEQRSELLSRLDPLAAEVIYSGKHLLESPHRVTSDETLVKIADRYEVPWQLLANINHVRDPIAILPGTELKVVRGPFRAEVDMRINELTLFLNDMYAGRFPIAIGNDPAPRPGTYTVQDKQSSKVFYDAAGSALPPGSPNNPYGDAWIDLGGNLCIHGSPHAGKPTDRGCISLAGDFADDLYGILSHGSTVTIK